MELSKNKIKFVSSLSLKKNRDTYGLFIAEGSKLVLDLIPSFKIKYLFCTEHWHSLNRSIIDNTTCEELIILSKQDDLKKITQLNTPPPVIAILYRDNNISIDEIHNHKDLVIALDGIQDPGNLGTIIRSADWFGVKYIFCSNDTVDVYNPKVINSTMGAIARVKIVYGDISDFITKSQMNSKQVYGTFLDGKNIYTSSLSNNNAVLVMGNEGKGVSQEVENIVNDKLLIPNFPIGVTSSESLNVAIATSVVLSEFRRRL